MFGVASKYIKSRMCCDIDEENFGLHFPFMSDWVERKIFPGNSQKFKANNLSDIYGQIFVFFCMNAQELDIGCFVILSFCVRHWIFFLLIRHLHYYKRCVLANCDSLYKLIHTHQHHQLAWKYTGKSVDGLWPSVYGTELECVFCELYWFGQCGIDVTSTIEFLCAFEMLVCLSSIFNLKWQLYSLCCSFHKTVIYLMSLCQYLFLRIVLYISHTATPSIWLDKF